MFNQLYGYRLRVASDSLTLTVVCIYQNYTELVTVTEKNNPHTSKHQFIPYKLDFPLNIMCNDL